MKHLFGSYTALIIIGFFLIIFIILNLRKPNQVENFKVVGGPNCPYKTDESCPWVQQGTGPACQIKEDHAGCPACCGNIDWYLGPKIYGEKCPGKVPPAFQDARDYYGTLQESFTSK